MCVQHYTTTIIWCFMIFNTIQPIQPIQWANGSTEATEKLQSTLRDLEAAKAQLEACCSERGYAKSHRSHRVLQA